MAMSKQLTLTRSVLARGRRRGATPAQPGLHRTLVPGPGTASRETAKRARLLKAAGFPADKSLDDYDWTNLRMPADWGRDRLEGLDFIDRHECPRALRARRHPRRTPPRHRPGSGRLQGRDAGQVPPPPQAWPCARDGPNRTTGSTKSSRR